MEKYKFLEMDGYSVKFNGEIMKIYIPKSYFENELAEFSGSFITTTSLFFFEVKSFQMEEKNKEGHIYTLKLPSKITFEFEDMYTEEKDIKNTGLIKYNVFILNKGNTFVKNINVEKSPVNAKDFIYMINKGRFPSIIPYEEIIKMYIDNIQLNDFNLGSPSVLFEIMIGELMRSKKDIKIPFRKAINDPNVSSFDYQNTNMKNLTSFSSTYASLSFEDINQSIISSIKREKNHDKEVISPVEKTIHY